MANKSNSNIIQIASGRGWHLYSYLELNEAAGKHIRMSRAYAVMPRIVDADQPHIVARDQITFRLKRDKALSHQALASCPAGFRLPRVC
jgi:hypothetical protein